MNKIDHAICRASNKVSYKVTSKFKNSCHNYYKNNK